MKILLIFTKKPYDGTDNAWNGLRLAKTLLEKGHDLRLFLLNDGIDLAYPESRPEGSEFDLTEMLQKAIDNGAHVKLCKTCITRCGIRGGKLISKAKIGSMPELAEWIEESDRVVTF